MKATKLKIKKEYNPILNITLYHPIEKSIEVVAFCINQNERIMRNYWYRMGWLN